MRGISEIGVTRVMNHFRQRYFEPSGHSDISIEEPIAPLNVSTSLTVDTEVNPVCEEENIWSSYINKLGD